MYDPKGRLVICNEPYQRIYNLPEHLLKPGTQLDDILGCLVENEMRLEDIVARGHDEAYVRRVWRMLDLAEDLEARPMLH